MLAAQLGGMGYHPQGTTHVIEHGTTNLPEEIERVLFDASDGLIRFARGGMEGAAAHVGLPDDGAAIEAEAKALYEQDMAALKAAACLPRLASLALAGVPSADFLPGLAP